MWELCKDSSQYLIDLWAGTADSSWQKAKSHFAAKGYSGEYLLINKTKTGFRLWKINIK